MSHEEKQLYGLIGYPVGHSFSAVMHNAAFKYLGINAEYQLFEVPPDKLEEFFKKTVFEKKIKGFNVTVPHKERAFCLISASVSISASMNRSVNTVSVEPDGTLSGTNTDGAGFSFDLKERGVGITGKRVVLLGAGGGAKSVATAVAALNPQRLVIFDIDHSKTEVLLGILNQYFPQVSVETVSSPDELKIPECDILINATPVGMSLDDPSLILPEWLHSGMFVYDLIYNPQETKLLKVAKESGCMTANGLGMLLWQGVLAFQFWTGKHAPVDVMRKALMEKINA